MDATTDVCVVRDGVSGDDIGWPASDDPADVLREMLNGMWEESDRDQVYVCLRGGVVAWVLVAPKPVEANGELANVVIVTRLDAGCERERYRVAYLVEPFDAADPDRPRFIRSEVIRVG